MSALPAVSLSEASLRRRSETRRQLRRRLAQIDAVLELVRSRVERASGVRFDVGRKVLYGLKERREDLARGLDELLVATDDEWTWRLRELEDARDRMLDFLDDAVRQYVVREPQSHGA